MWLACNVRAKLANMNQMSELSRSSLLFFPFFFFLLIFVLFFLSLLYLIFFFRGSKILLVSFRVQKKNEDASS